MSFRSTLLPSLVFGFLAAPAVHAGDLLVASWNTDSILRYDETTGAFVGAFVISGSGGLNMPHSLVYGPDGNLYVTSFGSDRVLRYDGTTGAFIDAFVSNGSGGLNGPTSAEFGANGNLFVSSYNTPGVLEYDGVTGAFVGTFIGPGNGLVNAEAGLFGPDGDYYLSNGPGDNVLRYDAAGTFVSVFASGNGLMDPHESLFGPNGNLYVASFGSNRVNEYDGQTGVFVRRFVTNGNGLINPHGLKFGADGALYVAAFGRDKINRYDGSTGLFLNAFVPAASGGLDGPIAFLFMPDPPSATAYGCGVNPVGSLSVLAGTPSIGTTLMLGVDNPLGTQPALSTPLLCLSLAPDANFPCGSLLPGFGQTAPGADGELLIDLAKPNHFLFLFGGLWAGPGMPSPIFVTLPSELGLIGLKFYAQGALFDSTVAMGIKFGLTEAIEFQVGF